jgi:DNA-binding NarL/FixJ family response regulator
MSSALKMVDDGVLETATSVTSLISPNLDVLTPAEQRVALLVADGLTNREIGERLFVSCRTIDAHLAHMFAKLNVSSRTRLAVMVASLPVAA